MASEIRANTLKNRVGLGTVSFTNTGPVVSGIITSLGADINGDLDVDGHTNLDNVSIAGVTTIGNRAFITHDLTITGTAPRLILSDTDHNSDFRINVDGGVFQIEDTTNSNADRLTINSSGNVYIANDLDVDGHTNLDNVNIAGVSTFTGAINANGGASVTGNITATGNLTPGGTLYLTDTIEHTDDSNTKIRFPAADNIAFETAGIQRLRITSTGDVNIGGELTQTDSRVHIQDVTRPLQEGTLTLSCQSTTDGAANNGATLRFYGHDGTTGRYHASIRGAKENGTSGNYAGYLAFNTRPAGGSMVEALRIESGGGLKFTGQGTSIPIGGILHHTNNNLYVRGGTNGLILSNDNNYTTVQIYDTYIKFETNDGSEQLRIDSDGRCIVGGGSHAGGSALVVKGGNQNTYSTIGMFSNHTNPAAETLLSQIRFGSNATAVSADIRTYADAAWGTNDYPTRLSFYTTPDSSNSRSEALRIDRNGKVSVTTGTVHATRTLAKFGIKCLGMDIYDGVGTVANYGMAFYNDPNTDKANGIGFFNDDGQTCGGYIVHQDKGSSNLGDLIFATANIANTPIERLRIAQGGNLKHNLTSPTGTSPFQNSHWYDRDGGNYTLTATDDNSFTAIKTSSTSNYNALVYKRVRMSKNCDIEFELSGNSPSNVYRHVGFVINGDGTASHSNWDRLVFRSRPASTSSNQIRIDKGGGGYGFNEQSSSIPTFFDGNERHILIQLRGRLVNVIVDGVVIISQKSDADFNRTSGWFGFGIYEGGENAQVTVRNLTIKNKFIQPHWLVRATGVNIDVSAGSALPYNQVIKASGDINNSSHYNNGSYRFNVPISGMYYVFVRAYRNSSTSDEVAFYVNGSVRNRFKPKPNSGDYIFAASCLIQLLKGEYIDVRAHGSGNFDNFYGNNDAQFSSWGGHLID